MFAATAGIAAFHFVVGEDFDVVPPGVDVEMEGGWADASMVNVEKSKAIESFLIAESSAKIFQDSRKQGVSRVFRIGYGYLATFAAKSFQPKRSRSKAAKIAKTIAEGRMRTQV